MMLTTLTFPKIFSVLFSINFIISGASIDSVLLTLKRCKYSLMSFYSYPSSFLKVYRKTLDDNKYLMRMNCT